MEKADKLHSDALVDFLARLCDAAAAETLSVFRHSARVDNKLTDAFDPVTQADRNAEQAIRALIEQHWPDHGIIGEEFGTSNEHASFQWIIDPIDGTRAFISGLPLWGTLIGLYRDGLPYAGVMDQPFTGERYFGLSAGANDIARSFLLAGDSERQTISTSTCQELSKATLMTTAPELLDNDADKAFFDVQKEVQLTRYGCDCYAYSMLAAGHVELVIESGLNIYDIAALIPIVESAGGLVTNWQGQPAHQGGQILAAANETLLQAAIAKLN
ncbi:MAG: histidinol-phosphatase [Pseudomonadota bacterium]